MKSTSITEHQYINSEVVQDVFIRQPLSISTSL